MIERLRHWLFGGPRLERLIIVHCAHSVAEAAFTVSLAGSIFFSVSPDAARSRVLLFLAITLAPFVLLAPLLGPFVDRLRGGLSMAIVATFGIRMVLALALSQQLRTLFLFPLAFGVLLTAKTYSITRIAAVPALVSGHDDLVAANARISRTATVVGALGSVAAIAIYQLTSASMLLIFATACYAIGAWLARHLRHQIKNSAPITQEAAVELVKVDVGDAVASMTVLRAAVGFALFQFGFSLRVGGDPPWVLGALVAANSLGAYVGTLIAPWARRRADEYKMLTWSLVAATVAMATSALFYNRGTLVGAIAVLGCSVSVARRAMEATIQRQAPHARTARVFARIETRLELAWVAAACAAVAIRADTGMGVLLLAGFLVTMTIVHVRRLAGLNVMRDVGAAPVSERLLLRAETLMRHNFYDEAYLIMLARERSEDDLADVDDVAEAAEQAVDDALHDPTNEV